MEEQITERTCNLLEMQNARQTGDVKKMQELMYSDPVVKAQIGQDNLDKMNQFMMNGSVNVNTGSTMMGSGR